jgi:hypothetical protein
MSDLRTSGRASTWKPFKTPAIICQQRRWMSEREVDDAITALQVALAEPEDPRIVELRTLMAEPTVTGVIFEVHRGPLSKSIREYGECPCPTHAEGDVRIEVKE